MATNANWTIVFEDKTVIKNHAEGASEGVAYIISDDSFWGQDKFSNIWAIQYYLQHNILKLNRCIL